MHLNSSKYMPDDIFETIKFLKFKYGIKIKSNFHMGLSKNGFKRLLILV